jgi:dienelactone hydrolase
MTARIRSIDYEHDGVELQGEFAWDDGWKEPRPCVVVVHDAMKSTQGFEQERAVTLAAMGYAGFALDVYGKGISGADGEDAYTLMKPYHADRSLLQARLLAGLRAAASQPESEGDQLAAIGYCFGGLCVLDLARMNAPVLGVASFHGDLAPPAWHGGAPPKEDIRPRVLALHGWDDPYAPPSMLEPFAREMSERRADWQLHAYGNTVHSFTNMAYDMPAQGALYDEKADRRSWRALAGFLDELFGAGPGG